MKTKRMISTISYNSELFLGTLMCRLVDDGIIDYGHWIYHLAEKDETKNHFHLMLQPSKSVDTQGLSRQFQELDPSGNGKFLGVMPWRFTKFEDWYLYGIHDVSYLQSKHLPRDYHYSLHDVRSTCPEMLQEDVRRIDLRSFGVGAYLAESNQKRKTWEEVIASGCIPATNWRYWKEVYMAMGGRVNLVMP